MFLLQSELSHTHVLRFQRTSLSSNSIKESLRTICKIILKEETKQTITSLGNIKKKATKDLPHYKITFL